MINLKNCRVIIKDTYQDSMIADTQIKYFEWKSSVIRVDAVNIDLKSFSKVQVLVFGEDGLYEFLGTIRNSLIAGEVEITLSRERQREGRGCKRYDFRVPGQIEGIRIDDHLIRLRIPMDITTINISASGILFETIAGSFHKGDIIKINLNMQKRTFVTECKIVRPQNATLVSEEYGCRIITFLNAKEGALQDAGSETEEGANQLFMGGAGTER